ncbi:MAG: NADH-quinone oxidoreductase subunit D [Sediminibacterium sp.]|jgi:NADH-quinone oxidoreductase subunit D|nr:NADH-quinone oxidoreductase subunit D [Chitinophagaceae bacterium]MCA6477186.1 NADH-quinone oxidoreductase subunit D [Chitinophagaceae bacterium]MCA6480210.1 NADH-quinone oxidoreductase subunit D [Chitinophagaceae bacterium]MCA6485479.1 NADH-quinone oxidoreductase subunit D [Chitinophagaceae bacterium]MCA6493484.1 NADH-quinone oxidoreductase subunit D [Chitinophagaceae bacterium]
MYAETQIISSSENNPQLKEGQLVINVGPQHPATHGVLHLVITLEGETIVKIEPHLGYIHRSIEKMSESLSYRQFIYVTSRMDYLSAHINNLGCALCVEKGMQIEVPARAQAIRIIMSELTRIASHELWIGAMAMDLGAMTPFFYTFRERETINDIMEQTCGARLTMNYMVPGGVMYDLHPEFVTRVRAFITQFKDKVTELEDLVTNNIIFRNRTEGIGILSKEDAISFGCTGPVARASGVDGDIRKRFPYTGYEQLDFEQCLHQAGDSFARYIVRIREMYQSIRIIEQLIDQIPEGDFQAKTKAVIKLPKGEFYTRVETARGELGVYIISEGGTTPYRIKYRSPGFSNLSALDHMARGSKIGDLMATMGTLDLVIPDIDR